MKGRPATKEIIAGRRAISVGNPDTPLPPGWRWVKLTEIARLESGHTPSRKRPEYWGGDIYWLGIGDAREHHAGVIQKTRETITKSGVENSSARVLPAGTVCLSRTASVGYACVLGTPMATSQDFVNWVCGEALNPHFLMYALVDEGRDGLTRFGKGTVHTTIYFPAVKALHLSLPPREEQDRIVAKIDLLLRNVGALRELLRPVSGWLAILGQAAVDRGLRGDLTADCRDGERAEESAAAFLEGLGVERRKRWRTKFSTRRYREPAAISEWHDSLPVLPATWEWATLDQLIVGFEAGRSPKASGKPAVGSEFGVLKVSAVTSGTFRPEENKAMRPGDLPEPGTTVCAGDLLITRANTTELVGAVTLVEEDYPQLMLSDKTLRVVYIPPTEPLFLVYALRTKTVRAFYETQATGTSASMRNLSQQKLGAAPIAVPPPAEMVKVATRVANAQSALGAFRATHESLVTSIDALERETLAKAFQGELVGQDSDAETVEMLLKRKQSAPPPRPRRIRRAASLRKDTSEEEGTLMPRDVSMSHLREVLENRGHSMEPRALWEASSLAGDIDAFYAQLRVEIAEGSIREIRVDERIRLIELKK